MHMRGCRTLGIWKYFQNPIISCPLYLKQNSNRGITWTVRAKKPGGEFPAQNLAKFGGSVIDLSDDLKYQFTFKHYSAASFLLT